LTAGRAGHSGRSHRRTGHSRRHAWHSWLLHLLSPLLVLLILLRVLRLLTRLPLLRLLTGSLVHLLVVTADLGSGLLAASRERLRSIDIDLEVALEVLGANDLVIDRAERGEDEIEVS
jgi:hypothetical protein